MRELESSIGISLLANDRSEGTVPEYLGMRAAQSVAAFHRSLPGYRPTPLVRLKSLAERLGVAEIFVKDESSRFGLGAFKGLGAIYAIFLTACQKLGLDPEKTTFEALLCPEYRAALSELVFVTATDGNHGKGVAWAAGRLGCRSVVYMPQGTAQSRAAAIRKTGPAEVIVTELTYDEAVALAAAVAEEKGWLLMQDTAFAGYQEIPALITAGYTTLAMEALRQVQAYADTTPTHLFLQAGVGSMAAALLGHMAVRLEAHCPAAIVVEPKAAACFYESTKAGDGRAHSTAGYQETIMAGLNCGTPSAIAWPLLRDFADYFVKCPDYVAARGMRLAANPFGRDPRFVSGESGAVCLGLVSLLLERPECAGVRRVMGFDRDSVLLLFSTEGATDPKCYEEILLDGGFSSVFI